MAGTEFATTPTDLFGASSGISDAVGAMGQNTLGEIFGDSGTFGHEGLSGAVSGFCATVHQAVEVMRRDAEHASASLVEAARTYVETDQQGEGVLGQIQVGGR